MNSIHSGRGCPMVSPGGGGTYSCVVLTAPLMRSPLWVVQQCNPHAACVRPGEDVRPVRPASNADRHAALQHQSAGCAQSRAEYTPPGPIEVRTSNSSGKN